MTRATQLTEAAEKIRDNHHMVPLSLKGKEPCGECKTGWQKRTLKDAIPKFKDTDNLGILLGAHSGNLVRRDPDYQAIPEVTDFLFPEKTLTFGRASSPHSGRLYTSDVKSTDFKLPKSMKDHPGLPVHDGKPSVVVFQILGTGKQTMAPPSTHPDNGELLVWESELPPAAIDGPDFLRRCGIEAFLMAVRHFWPALGSRNEAALALGRVLLEVLAGRHPDDAERCAIVDELVIAVAMDGGDGLDSRTGKEGRAAKTLEKMRSGEVTTGMPRLLELLELPTDVGKTFRKWLGLTAQADVDLARKRGPRLPYNAPYKAAQTFINLNYMHDGRRTLHRYRGTFWRWTGISYREHDEREELRAEAYQFLDDAIIFDDKGRLVQPDKHDVDQLIDALKALCLLPEDDAPMWIGDEEQAKDPRDFLPVANGLLHLPSDELQPHTPGFYNLTSSTVAYDPNAPVPVRWNKFLEEVWPGDQESKDTLHEILGYLLIADTSQQKIFLWIGEPRSGKGTTLQVLTSLIGKGSVAGTSMGDLKCQFGLQPLIGKSLATLADARLGRGDPAILIERLLSISGGDSQGIQRKYKGDWNGCLAVRFLMLSNELPSFADPTGTIGTRFIVLEFANSFLGKEDPHLLAKLLAEQPGILNLAIAGYRRLKERGRFIQPDSAKGLAEELKTTDVRAFIEEKCTLGPDEKAATDRIYTAYQDYCETNGYEVKNSRQFGRLLKSAAKPVGITKHRPRDGKDRRYYYCGIALNGEAKGDPSKRRTADALPPGWEYGRGDSGRKGIITDSGVEVPKCEGVGTEQEQAAYRLLRAWEDAHRPPLHAVHGTQDKPPRSRSNSGGT